MLYLKYYIPYSPNKEYGSNYPALSFDGGHFSACYRLLGTLPLLSDAKIIIRCLGFFNFTGIRSKLLISIGYL